MMIITEISQTNVTSKQAEKPVIRYIQAGKEMEYALFESHDQLKHLKFEKLNDEHIVTLVDKQRI